MAPPIKQVSNLVKAARLSRALNKVTKAPLPIQEPILNVGWAPKLRFNSTWAHTNADDVLVTSPLVERWDVSRGMPRTGGWVSVGPPGGMMAERPYIGNYQINLEKPMVQVGEVPTLAGQKNSTRSSLVRLAEQLGADGFIFRDIADNKAKHLTVAYIFDPNASATKLELPPLTWETYSASKSPGITKDSDLSFLQQAPKRISNAERAGVPRGERNNVISQRDYPVGTASRFIRKGEIAIMDDKARYPKGFWKLGDYEKIFSNETIQVPDKFSPTGYTTKSKSKRNFYFTEGDPVAEVRLNGNNKLRGKYNSRRNYFGKDLPQEFYDYLEQIKTLPINPNFTNLQSLTTLYPYKKLGFLGEKSETEYLKASDIQSKYVYDFRKYLEHLGYDSSKVTDHQMLQLLTDQYRSLTKNMTGKTKGQVFWHEGPEYHELFDFAHTGENTGNMGAMGPGNYFSSAASAYGKVSQPYLITDIKETPIASESAIQKGLIPRYVSPGVGINSGYYEYLRLPEEERLKFPAELRDKYEAIISKIKNKVSDTPTESGRLWIDPVLIEHSGVAPRLSLRHIEPMEFMIRRNTGIKSLFPHPQTFVRDANGNIVINRDWNDIRVNYKKGGKLNNKK